MFHFHFDTNPQVIIILTHSFKLNFFKNIGSILFHIVAYTQRMVFVNLTLECLKKVSNSNILNLFLFFE